MMIFPPLLHKKSDPCHRTKENIERFVEVIAGGRDVCIAIRESPYPREYFLSSPDSHSAGSFFYLCGPIGTSSTSLFFTLLALGIILSIQDRAGGTAKPIGDAYLLLQCNTIHAIHARMTTSTFVNRLLSVDIGIQALVAW